jgi:hypothetical protein
LEIFFVLKYSTHTQYSITYFKTGLKVFANMFFNIRRWFNCGKCLLKHSFYLQLFWVILAQSFSPFSAQDGRQVCRPAMNFSVTKMQEESKIAQLVFLKQNKFSFYFQNTRVFLFGQEKPDNQEKPAQFQSH